MVFRALGLDTRSMRPLIHGADVRPHLSGLVVGAVLQRTEYEFKL